MCGKTIAIILAAGSGKRFGGKKQYFKLKGKPILQYSLEAFSSHPEIDDILVAIQEEDRPMYDSIAANFSILPPIIGGQTRQESSRNSLFALREINPKNVLIHDAARPHIAQEFISRITHALQSHTSAIPVIPGDLGDSSKQIEINGMPHSVQTPQGFDFQTIMECQKCQECHHHRDDSSLLQHFGHQLHHITGHSQALKMTHFGQIS